MIDKEIKLDFERSERIGFGEAIFCADKSSAQISRILNKAHDSGLAMLITRLEPKKHDRLESEHKDLIDYDPVSETGFFHAHLEPAQPASVAIVTAGTSDHLDLGQFLLCFFEVSEFRKLRFLFFFY